MRADLELLRFHLHFDGVSSFGKRRRERDYEIVYSVLEVTVRNAIELEEQELARAGKNDVERTVSTFAFLDEVPLLSDARFLGGIASIREVV